MTARVPTVKNPFLPGEGRKGVSKQSNGEVPGEDQVPKAVHDTAPLTATFLPFAGAVQRGPDRIERPLGGNGIAQKF